MKNKMKLLKSTFLLLAVALFGFNAGSASAVTYTLADVALHHTASDCWVAIQNNVYNLTAFIPAHPGGQSVIIALCGTDGTLAIENAPHGIGVLGDVSQYIIGTLTTNSTPILTSVTVAPTTSSIAVLATETLIASPKDQNGAAFVGATTTFASSNTAVATVNSTTGVVRGVSAGMATITATSVSGTTTVTGTARVTVTTIAVTPVLTSVTIIPTTSSIAVGASVGLTATPMDQNGVAFVGATTTFSSGSTAIATVNSTTGVVTGVSAGTATITATSVSGTVTVTGTTTVTVTTVTGCTGGDDEGENEGGCGTQTSILTRVTVTPATSSLAVGRTETLRARPVNQNGRRFTGATTTFTSSNTAIATVNSTTGVVRGVSAGTVTITATSVSGTTTVTGTARVTVTTRRQRGNDD